jgi:hypothetical protein
VVCEALLDSYEPPLTTAGSAHGHLQERIGWLMPRPADHWWDITEATDVTALTSEVSDLIATKAAPYVMQYLDTDALIALWESGRSPGLTEKRRVEYLDKLKKSQYHA